MPGNRSDVESFKYITAGWDSVSPEFIALVIVGAIWPGFIKNVLVGLYSRPTFSRNTPFWLKVVLDFCMTILPAELLVTLWNTKAFQFLIIICACAAILIAWKIRKGRLYPAGKVLFLEAKVEFPSRISYSRSYINILTAISILAVDFPLFPAYFRKSRLYGTSLMDTGLGFYICSNAIVSPEARGIINTCSFRRVLKKATVDTLPLIVLGILRYTVMSSIGYHFTSNEYGRHWNFFFTLATVKIGLYTLALVLNVLSIIIEAFVKHRWDDSNQLSDIFEQKTNDNSDVLEAINYNGLVFFIIANIFTGLINLTIDTSSKSDTIAFTILTSYMFTLSVIFVLLHKYKIRIKPLLVKFIKR
ncbi:hypothetical protein ACF0H5_021044 [Mactra antiquata]